MMTAIMDWEINIVLWFQQFSPALDGIFKAFTFAGEELFFFLLLPIVAWCIDRRTGLQLAIVFFISSYFGAIVKELTNQLRPYQYDDHVLMLKETSGKAFPSLHTQSTVVIWGFLSLKARKRWLWIISAVLCVGVPISRVYLGLHFPHDLAGGYVFGAVLLALFLRFNTSVETWFHNLKTWVKLAIAGLLPLLLFLSFPTTDQAVHSVTGIVLGAWIGIILERLWVQYAVSSIMWKRVACYALGMAGIMLFKEGLGILFAGLQPEMLFRFIRYGFIGIWFTLGAPWVFVKLSLADKDLKAARLLN